jgi:hypothetical protein
MPKFEFALEKFLEDRRKRPKEEIDTSHGAISSDEGMAPTKDFRR